MKSSAVILASLILTCAISACGAVSQVVDGTPLATPTMGAPVVTVTATVGYQATSIVAMTAERSAVMTNEAVNVTIAQITAEADRNKLEAERLRLSALQISSHSTEVSIAATQAAATYIPLTATVGAEKRAHDAEVMNYELIRPTLERAAIDNKSYAEYAGEREAGRGFLTITSGLLMVAVAVFLLNVVLTRTPVQQSQGLRDLNAEDAQKKPMYFQPTQNADENKVERIDIDIPCTQYELLMFAEGLCRLNKTLAIGAWEKTDVHKRIQPLRAWMLYNKFSQHVLGGVNEFTLTRNGEQFLQDTLTAGEAPAPYKCKFEDIETVEE